MNRYKVLSYLNDIYNRKTNDISIIYGSRYVGIRSFVFDFINDKDKFYYKAVPCDFKMQINNIVSDLSQKVDYSFSNVNDLSLLIKEFCSLGNNKKVIVIDNFFYIYNENPTLINFLISVIREVCSPGSIMLLLTADNPDFISNVFLKNTETSVYELSGVFELDPLNVLDVLNLYKGNDISSIISLYSVIGGDENLWKIVDLKKNISLKDFIVEDILKHDGRLFEMGNNILPEELRERSVYNTLLYYISHGYEKLNDIHEMSGFDRAKISVYLKNLAKYNIVSKVNSPAYINDRACKKGVYQIQNNFIKFYYRFIFANVSNLLYMSAEKFYKKYIEPNINLYKEIAYRDYCMEKLCHAYPDVFNNVSFDILYDKNNVIDFVGIDENGKIVLCATRLISPHMSFSRLENIIDFCKKYNVKYDYICLISAVDFDQKLHLYSSVHKDIKLLTLK